MRAVVSALAAAWLLAAPSPAATAPPEDIATYCRSVHPQVPFQVRCLNLENAAAARVGRTGPGPDPEGWNRCRSSAPSWSAMEQCLADSAQAARTSPAGAAGAAGTTGAAVAPAERAPEAATTPGASGGAPPPAAGAPSAPPAPPSPPAAGVPPSSTVILGPRPTPTPASERDRQTRAISEADADRQLRSVLERNPSARCTKKQYGPGWVIACE